MNNPEHLPWDRWAAGEAILFVQTISTDRPMPALRRDVLMLYSLKNTLSRNNFCENLHKQSGLFLIFKKDSEKSDTGNF